MNLLTNFQPATQLADIFRTFEYILLGFLAAENKSLLMIIRVSIRQSAELNAPDWVAVLA
jgi:hypothetical protein